MPQELTSRAERMKAARTYFVRSRLTLAQVLPQADTDKEPSK